MDGRRLRLVASWALGVTLVVMPASSWAQTGSIVIGSGLLTGTVSSVVLNAVTLSGANQSTTVQPGTPWDVIDARGTGAAWSVTLTASGNLTSAAGTVETTPRSLAIGNLQFQPGSFTAGLGSDPTTNMTTSNLTVSTSAQTYASCSADCKGTYTYTPTFDLTVPANAYRSNYSVLVGLSSLNAYQVTLTFTLA